jgi:hypothetical protein
VPGGRARLGGGRLSGGDDDVELAGLTIARCPNPLGRNQVLAFISRRCVGWIFFISLTPGRPCDRAGATSARLRTVICLPRPVPSAPLLSNQRRILERRSTPGRAGRFNYRRHR